MDPLHRISRARASLILTAPFYATLALDMGAVERTDIDTMATDGESLFFNPAFVAELTDAELRGVIAHEVMHVANLHHTRRGSRDPQDWNIACDYVINAALIAEGFTLPDGGLIDSRFDGMSADKVFSILQAEKKPGDDGQQGQGQSGSGQGQGAPDPGKCGGVLDAAPAHDATALQAAEMNAKAKVIQAATAAKAAGSESAEGRRLADAIRKPVIDWRNVLRRYVDESARKDYAWHRPNRRHVAAGVYLPGQVPDGMHELAVIIDTSGSIDTSALTAFLSELQGAIDDAAPDNVTVIQCDTKVRYTQRFQPGDPIAVSLHGGGGTNMSPAMDLVRDASAVIVFTDCEFRGDPTDPGAPVLWARWGGGGKVPTYGELIDVAA